MATDLDKLCRTLCWDPTFEFLLDFRMMGRIRCESLPRSYERVVGDCCDVVAYLEGLAYAEERRSNCIDNLESYQKRSTVEDRND